MDEEGGGDGCGRREWWWKEHRRGRRQEERHGSKCDLSVTAGHLLLDRRTLILRTSINLWLLTHLTTSLLRPLFRQPAV